MIIFLPLLVLWATLARAATLDDVPADTVYPGMTISHSYILVNQKRFLSTGGADYYINQGVQQLPGGLIYGAVSGSTDGGFGSFETGVDEVLHLANGTLDQHNAYICSEGGREGWTTAIRYSFQMVSHLWANVVEKIEGIVNHTIVAYDGLDGRVDGVVSRFDLCKLHFNLTSTINKPHCAANGDTPAQNATISAQAVEVVETVLGGIKDLQGNQVYLFYQPGALLYGSQAEYNTTSKAWGLDINSFGGEYVARFLKLKYLDNLPTLSNQTYEGSIHTTWPDLTWFKEAGGKVLHYHGEQDRSIPTAPSVHYYESFRKAMYPKLSKNASNDTLGEWDPLFLVPGASDYMNNYLQPNVPVTLTGTVLKFVFEGEEQQSCAWPLRPLWYNNGTTMECECDESSLDTWTWNLDAFDMPVY
ncbi:tannase and feruloyl esterase-domain-containing protein [Aspergillus spinulosporus]